MNGIPAASCYVPGTVETTTARARIIAGSLRGEALRQELLALAPEQRETWIDLVLGIAPPPPDRDLPRGAVPYVPAGVEEILALVEDVPVRATDELVDLGAGLGRVIVLAHLLSGARAHGIELQAHLVGPARATCAALGLPAVTVACADAAEVELAGTVFFLYAPFNGEMLARVLARLASLARRQPITVATVDLPLEDVPWLVGRPSRRAALTIYTSVQPA